MLQSYRKNFSNSAGRAKQARHEHVITELPKPPPVAGRPPQLDEGGITFFGHNPTEKVPMHDEWLRDHCQCSKCVHPATKQRLIETFDDIPADISTKSIHEDYEGFRVIWHDGHESYYRKDWLEACIAVPKMDVVERQGLVPVKLWSGKDIKENPPTVDYEAAMFTDEGLKNWLYKIREYGFCYVENTPVTPEATEKLLERIAFIRPTHYGGFYDFTSDLSKGDTAYTQLGIGAHTDNTYFSDPAGLQVFHLLSHTDGEGGASQLVDGFAAAHELSQTDREAYDELSSARIYSHASGNEDSSIQPFRAFPTLVHDPQHHNLVQVRWNTTDRSAIDINMQHMREWYKAARCARTPPVTEPVGLTMSRQWTSLLKRYEYWEQLQPGKPLSKTFDSVDILKSNPYIWQSSIIGAFCTVGLHSPVNAAYVAVIVSYRSFSPSLELH